MLFSGPGEFRGLTFSPDGSRILLGWKSADQWLFLSPNRPKRIEAFSNISLQFAPGKESAIRGFPDPVDWCCGR